MDTPKAKSAAKSKQNIIYMCTSKFSYMYMYIHGYRGHENWSITTTCPLNFCKKFCGVSQSLWARYYTHSWTHNISIGRWTCASTFSSCTSGDSVNEVQKFRVTRSCDGPIFMSTVYMHMCMYIFGPSPKGVGGLLSTYSTVQRQLYKSTRGTRVVPACSM